MTGEDWDSLGGGLGRRVEFTEKGLDLYVTCCGAYNLGGINISAVEKDQMLNAKTL